MPTSRNKHIIKNISKETSAESERTIYGLPNKKSTMSVLVNTLTFKLQVYKCMVRFTPF